MIRSLLLALLLVVGFQANATVTIGGAERAIDTSTATTTKTITLASNVPSGASVIIGILNRTNSTATLDSVSDPVNGTWSLGTVVRSGPTAVNTNNSWFVVLTNSAALTGTTNRTITITTSVGISSQIVGIWASSDLGALTYEEAATAVTSTTNTTNWDTNTIAVDGAGVIVGFLAIGNSQSSTAPTMDGAGETLQTTAVDSGSFRTNLITQTVASAATHGLETTVSSTTAGAYHLISLLEPAASGGLLLRRRRQ